MDLFVIIKKLNKGLNVKGLELIYFGIYFYTRKSVKYVYDTMDDD
jgi:hypothetical protein